MHKVLLIHISSIGCCNPLVTRLNNGNFGFPYSLLPRFAPLQSGATFSTPAFSTPCTLVLPRFPLPRFLPHCTLVLPRFPLPRFLPHAHWFSRVFSRPTLTFHPFSLKVRRFIKRHVISSVRNLSEIENLRLNY